MKTSSIYDELKIEFPQLLLKTDVPYRELTTLGVGSTLPCLAEPANDLELHDLLEYTSRRGIEVFVIGRGSNFVGADAPVSRLGIRLSAAGFTVCQEGNGHFAVGAGLRLRDFALRAAELGYGGLAKLSGIPATLGGALRMNAGAGGSAIGEHVFQLCGWRLDGSPWTADGSDIVWGAHTCSIPEDVVITAALIDLPKGNRDEELAAIQAESVRRREADPQGRSAGCTFRNISSFEPAGLLIDRAGLKGIALGGLEVSPKHANFIVNTTGEASLADYLDLLALIRRQVAEKSGFYLTPEVIFVDPEAAASVVENPPSPRVALLLGGESSEREISLRSGAAVSQALRNAGYRVDEIDLVHCRTTPEMLEADVVYPVLHGGAGEDGRLQELLEEHNLKFVGSGSDACALVMDKIRSKRLAERLGIPTAKWAVVTPGNLEFPVGLSFPVFLKVPNEGSTIGIIRVDSLEEWPKALEEEFKMTGELLVEEMVKGTEITVPILAGEILPAIEIRPPNGLYDYDAKYLYKGGKTEYFCPIESLPQEVVEYASKLARLFYFGSGSRDILRVDFIVDAAGVPVFLEGNSIPGCTATSLVPKAARQAGCSFERMVSTLVGQAMKRPAEPPLPLPAPDGAGGALPPRLGPNRALLTLSRWLFRLVLVLAALPLLWAGLQFLVLGQDGGLGWMLVIPGLLLLVVEAVFAWFNRLERY